MAYFLVLLSVLKLIDVKAFVRGFKSYNLLTRRIAFYGYIYSFIELALGLSFLTNSYTYLSAPISIFVGLEGAISIFKAVYIDKVDLKCACVGGGSKVPLGIISFLENFSMFAMGTFLILN
jgi:hypothetical protein